MNTAPDLPQSASDNNDALRCINLLIHTERNLPTSWEHKVIK